MASLKSRVSLVTGAARGIGLAISKALLDHGGRVVLLDIMEETGQETCRELRKKYGEDRVVFYRCDVTSAQDLRSAFVRTVEKYGNLDIVVNNAGIVDEIGWERTVNINLTAVIQGTYLGIEFMSKDNGGRGGSVINISSYAGLLPEPISPVYSATKAGVVAFTQTLRRLAKTDGVRVNCVCPTWIDTDMGRMAMFDSDDRTKEMVKHATLLSPDLVGDAVIQLVQDTSKAGAVARVTPHNGVDFHTFDKTTLISLLKPKL